jgi:hypothetical protein
MAGIDETGNRYGNWVVLGSVPSQPLTRHRRFAVRCDCGNESEVDGYILRQGRSNSCGCRAKPEGSSPSQQES